MKEQLLLTAAVSLQKPVIDLAYDIPAMSAVTDLLILRGYNFHGTYDTYTHHHAPLYGHPGDTGNNLFLNIVSRREVSLIPYICFIIIMNLL